MDRTKIILEERDMPTKWYNILPDMPTPLPPPLSPQTLKPAGPEDFAPLFPMALIQQEMSDERYIDIPEEVLDVYKLYRPSPLFRARRLEKALGTPAKIFYKYEGGSPSGSHKTNTAIAQAYYNKLEGTTRLATETGAGQWGSALSMACQLMGLECMVYMVKASYNQKPYRHMLMEAYGAKVVASPSELTNAGRAAMADYPNHPGTLGLAISEAVEDTVTHPGTHYSLGSVLNHVILHQTIIGEELQKQFALIDTEPDVIYGCVGGGSSFGGVAMPYVRDNLSGKRNVRLVAVEPASCPTLTKGLYAYDYGDEAKMAPVVMMYTLGHDFIPSPIHAGGLRYHGDSPIISSLYHDKVIEAEAFKQMGVFEAAMQFIHTESILPAPESAHAIKAAIDEAMRCKENGEEKNICFLLTGHGHFDLAAYDAYLNGKLEDDEYNEADEARAIASLPKVG